MYCSACQLEYSDLLKYCKQCGNSLVRRADEAAAPSRCCTRCGARVIPGENFCQQCGARLQVRSEDTTIGACVSCGTPWRSAWLYCRTCGTDREHALQFNSAPGPPEQSVPTVAMEAVSAESIAAETYYVPETNPVLDLNALVREATGEALRCGRCGAEALPYAQFCEICGASLTVVDLRRGVSKPLAEAGDAAPGNSNEFRRTVEVTAVPEAGPAVEADREEAAGGEEDESRRPTNRIAAPGFDQIDQADQFGLEIPAAVDQGAVDQDAAYQDALHTGGQRTNTIDPPSPVEVNAPDIAGVSNEPLPTVPTEQNLAVDKPPDNPASEPVSQSATEWAGESGETDWELRRDLRRPAAISPSAPLDVLNTPDISAARNRRAIIQTLAIGVCLVILVGLIGFIIWQARTPRRPGTEAGPTPAVAPSQAAPSRSEPPEGMVYVPGGSLRLGRDDGDEYASPAHEVRVEPFFMDRTEVSNEQYQRFIAETGRTAPPHWRDGRYPAGEASLPVVNVTWDDAGAYAQWAGKRLPTEEEWEYAARGSDGRLYPWGNEWSASRANTREAGRGRIVAVGSFPEGASPFGVLDLIGNVWEWTASDLRSYESDGRILAPGKVIRGGAWDVPYERATATYRGVVQPDRSYDKTGFRCVKSAP